MGTLVNVSVTGEPPFWLEYVQTVRETGARSVIRVDVAKSRHSLVFKPTESGTYEYEFVKVMNKGEKCVSNIYIFII